MTSAMVTGLGLVKRAPGAGNVQLSPVDIQQPGEGEALVKVAAAGICGTDLHIIDGEWPVNAPVTVGHEFSGTVLAVGSAVDESWLGARVVSEVFYSTDGTCDACRSGHRNLCAHRQSLGSHVNGAFAPAVRVPVANLHRLPDSIALEDAALLEPLACVAGALCDPPIINPGDRVLVTGPGAIGILAAQVARANGAHPTLLGRTADEHRLAVARKLGIAVALSESVGDRMRESFDVVIECAGSAAAANTCLTAVRRKGRYVQLGLFAEAVRVDLNALCFKDLTLSSGFGATPEGFRRALLLVSAGLVALGPLITRIAPLHEWESIFDAARRGDGVKFLFAPSV